MNDEQLQQCQEIVENSKDLLKSMNSLYNQEFIDLCRKLEITDKSVIDCTYVSIMVMFITGMIAGRCVTTKSFYDAINSVHKLIDSSAANFPAYLKWIEKNE
jgi:hypothetical protein